MVGKNVLRVDGPAKLTGQARYVDDLHIEGCLHGATVRSAVARGKIRAITLDPSYDWSGITVVTAADIPGENVVALMTDDQPALARGEIRHVAEPVALVAASTRARALEAAGRVRVEVEALPPLLDPARATDPAVCAENTIFASNYGPNVYSHIVIERGEARARLEEAEKGAGAGVRLIEGEYSCGLQEQLYIEPQGMIVIPEGQPADQSPDAPARQSLTVIGSMQCPYYIHKALKRAIGHDRFRVVQAATGGGFGGKEEYPSLVAIHAALLAIKSGRPVRLIYGRGEDLRATTKRHPAVMRYRSAVEASTGRLLACEADIRFDGGAYNTLSPVVNSRGVIHAFGPYRCDHTRAEATMVATNTPPNGAFRGFGAPQVQWAAERHMDRIARELGLDPLAVRRVNLYRDGDVTPTGQALRDVGAGVVLEAALARAGSVLPARRDRPGSGGAGARLSAGRGLALAWHGCGFTGNGEAALKGKADVALETDEAGGWRVRIYAASTDIGQGTETIFPQIVAEELGVPFDKVSNTPHDTAIVPDSGPTVASRTAMVVGGVVRRAAAGLRAMAEASLSAVNGAAGADFSAVADALAARGLLGLRARAEYTDDGTVQWDPKTYQGDAYPTYGWSCVIVDLDVDLDTGEVFYRRLIQATDVGRALNPVLAAGQLEGGALQGLGYATCEEVVLDAQGGMRNNRLTNYIIPTALDAPEMETILIEIPYAGGPFGAKGIGEIPHDVPHAAAAAAIERACGAALHRLPMTPERVLSGMLEVEAAGTNGEGRTGKEVL